MVRPRIWLRIAVLLLFLYPIYHLSWSASFIEIPEVVLFGAHGLLIDQNAVTTGAAVVSGADIQVKNNALVEGDLFAEGNLFLFNNARIDGDATLGGSATLKKKASITGTLSENSAELPEIVFPDFEEPSPSEEDIAVPDGETITLPEGAYRHVEVGAEATLIFSGGRYDMATLTSSPDATLVIDGTVTLILEGPFDLFPNLRVVLNRPGLEPSDFVLFVSSAGINKVRQNADFKGLIYAPNGSIEIEQNVTATGIFMADEVVVEQNAEITFSPECSPEDEICDDRIDQDCDYVDLDCRDADQDGDGFTINEGDCDDFDPAVSPWAFEICDGRDNNCDGDPDGPDAIDAGLFFADTDGDGFGDTGNSVIACFQPLEFVPNNQDCNDNDFFISPDAVEVCDTIDNNCDGKIDNDVTDAPTWYADLDGDTFGNPDSTTRACSRPEGFVPDNTDCNDSVSTSHPGASEICDTIDNDCDGSTDEAEAAGGVIWFADSDGDGFGSTGSPQVACTQPAGFVLNSSDCDDSFTEIHPGAIEVCDDKTDNNCDGADSSCLDATVDQDADGFSASDGDCDDLNDRVFPVAGEFLDSVDNDCDGLAQTIDVTSGNSNFLGEATEDQAGFRVARAGDVNGDGFSDFLISAPFNNDGGMDAGKVYLIYGSDNLSVGLSLADADAFLAGENAGDHFGHVVAGAGDVNHDGFDDFLISAPASSKTYLVFGKADLAGPINLSGGDVVTFTGGFSVAGVGDVNHDSFDDFLIGAPGDNNATGKTYLVYGSNSVASGSLSGVAGAIFVGEATGGSSGQAVAGAGDVNGDGFADILIGAPGFVSGGFASGKAYLIYGGAAVTGNVNLGTAIGFTDDPADLSSGSALSGAGDMNGDGFDDILIGSPGFGGSSGKTSLIYGRSVPLAGGRLPSISDAQFFGDSNSSAGLSLDTFGDINGDGCDDLLVGAPGHLTDTGRAYLVFGGGTGCVRPAIAGPFNLAASDFTFVGSQPAAKSGFSVALLGDVNGDGQSDLLIGSPLFDHSHDAGETTLFVSAPIGGCGENSGVEICDNGRDEDCNDTDLSCNDVDNDLDDTTEHKGDCNDANPAINPTAQDICNGTDDDCSCFTAVAKDWFAVVAGNGHTLAIKAVNPEDTFGTLWGWGRNDEGQVGDGLISHKKRPVQISSAGWAMIAAGGKASLAVKADGTLWGWGDNSQSQLTTIISKVPKQIGVDQDWVEVSLGLNHAAGIRLVAGQRQLFVWGKNDAKQLGLPAPNGNKQVVKQPTQVPDISGTQWMKVFAGNRFTLAITGDGRLFAWGNNEHGQLGLGSGTVGTNVATPMQVGGATNWASVAPGGGHVVVLNSGKELFTWGDNTHGQLGTGTTGGIVDSPPASPLLSNVKSITASWNSSFAVKGDNTVLSWGSNFKSALGRSTTGDDANPTLIAATAGGVSVVGNLITAGPFHPLVIDTTDQTKGRIFGWGDNSFGQLGLGDGISKQEVPAAVTGGVLDCSAAGQIDEDFVSQSTTCGTGACASSGTTSCSNGTEANSCTPTLPSVSTDTTCDGVDNDCSGTADEDYVATSTTCGVGACAGNTGSLTCVSGSTQDSCDPTIGAGSEVCGNGIDENCNGSDLSCNDVDQDGDGFTPNGGDCNDNNAAIKPGATEICDGLDNDCDSPTQIDEKLGIVFGASKFGRAVFGENCGFTFP